MIRALHSPDQSPPQPKSSLLSDTRMSQPRQVLRCSPVFHVSGPGLLGRLHIPGAACQRGAEMSSWSSDLCVCAGEEHPPGKAFQPPSPAFPKEKRLDASSRSVFIHIALVKGSPTNLTSRL